MKTSNLETAVHASVTCGRESKMEAVFLFVNLLPYVVRTYKFVELKDVEGEGERRKCH